MKTIKFINKDKRQFTAALRKNVNEYFKNKNISTKGNGHMLIKALAMLALYFVPFIVMLSVPIGGWLFMALWLLTGIGMAGIGMGVMHDAAHGSFSSKGWVNKLFGSSIYFIGGNLFTWKVQHNVLHHTYTNIDGFDEDIEPKGSLRLSAQTPYKKIHRFQHIYAFALYALMTLSRTFKEVGQLMKYNRRKITRQQGAVPSYEMGRLLVTKAAYLFVVIGLPVLLTPFSWWMVLIGFLLMHFAAGLLMSTVFQMAHIVEEASQPLPDKDGVINTEWAIHELETTANFGRRSRLFAWLIGGLNYQIEHHLFPNICHVHYKAIAPIVKSTAHEFGIPYRENRTFFSAMASHVRLLKRLGKGAVQV